MKRLFSLLMALAMMATLSVSVFADDPTPNFEAEGTVQLPTIDVTYAGGDGKVFVNPFGYPMAFDDAAQAEIQATDAAATTYSEAIASTHTSDKVFSPTYWIENNTTLPLAVYVNGKATPSTGVTLATATVPANSTKKEVFLYATFKKVGTDEGCATWSSDKVVHFTPSTYSKNDKFNFVLASGYAKTEQFVINLPASTSQANKGKIAFQFTGSAAPNPTTPWGEGDTVDVALAFSYKLDTTPTA